MIQSIPIRPNSLRISEEHTRCFSACVNSEGEKPMMDEFFKMIGMTTVAVVVIFAVMLLLGISYVGLSNLRELWRSFRDVGNTLDCVANRDFKYKGEDLPPSMAEIHCAINKAMWGMSALSQLMQSQLDSQKRKKEQCGSEGDRGYIKKG